MLGFKRVFAVVAGTAALAMIATPGTASAAEQPDPPGLEQMHELMMGGNPGMARMCELMEAGNPGMARLHELMM